MLHLDVSFDLHFLLNTFGRSFLKDVVIVVYAVVYKLFVTFEPFIVIIDFVVYLAQAHIAPRAVSHTFQHHSVSHSVSPINWRFTWHQV